MDFFSSIDFDGWIFTSMYSFVTHGTLKGFLEDKENKPQVNTR